VTFAEERVEARVVEDCGTRGNYLFEVTVIILRQSDDKIKPGHVTRRK